MEANLQLLSDNLDAAGWCLGAGGDGSQITPSLKKERDAVCDSDSDGKMQIDRLFLLTAAFAATARRLFCFIFALHFRKAGKLSFVK